MKKITKSKQEWRAQLDTEQYRVTREAGTEAPSSGQYCDHTATVLGKFTVRLGSLLTAARLSTSNIV